MFTTWTKISLALSILFSILLLIGFLLPQKYEIEREITIHAATQNIFPHLNNPQQWAKWMETAPAPTTVQVKESLPQIGTTYHLQLENSSTTLHGALQFKDEENLLEGQSKLLWKVYCGLGKNPINRYVGLRLENSIGAEMEKGLENLKKLVEREGK